MRRKEKGSVMGSACRDLVLWSHSSLSLHFGACFSAADIQVRNQNMWVCAV